MELGLEMVLSFIFHREYNLADSELLSVPRSVKE
jgi:hypothetical protein